MHGSIIGIIGLDSINEVMVTDISTYFRQGIDFEKAGKYVQAADMLEKSIKAGFENEHVYISLGRIYRELGDNDKSVLFFERAHTFCQGPDESHMSNRILNEIEISQKKVVMKSSFRGLGVVLTTKCNLQCIMCNSCKTPWDIPGKTVDDIIRHMPNLQRVMWLGGEVFLSPHFERLFDAADLSRHLHQTVVTNGLLINEHWAVKLAQANMNLTYSIDGITQETYEHIRRGARFSDLLKSVRLMHTTKNKYRSLMTAERKMVMSMNFVVMKSNYRQLRDAVEFANENGFEDLTFTPVDYIQDDENIFLRGTSLCQEILDESMAVVVEKARKYGISIHNWLPPIDSTKNTQSKPLGMHDSESSASGQIFCFWPWQHIFIDVGGQVKPHCLCHKKIGDVNTNDLSEIWNTVSMMEYRRRIINQDHRGLCNSICISSKISRDCMGILW